MDEASRKKIEEGKKKLEALKAKKKAAAAAAAGASTTSAPPQLPEFSAPPDAASDGLAVREENESEKRDAPAANGQDDTAALKTKLAEAEARAERLQGQALSLMQALANEQNPDGNSPARQASEDAASLQERLAERDEKVGALKIALAERDEQLDLANTQLEGMKEMMREGGAEEARVLKERLAERDEQLELANTQLEGMKEMMESEALSAREADLRQQLDQVFLEPMTFHLVPAAFHSSVIFLPSARVGFGTCKGCI
jgi:hypothetical protein